jgi:hypothetical protein
VQNYSNIILPSSFELFSCFDEINKFINIYKVRRIFFCQDTILFTRALREFQKQEV